MSKLIAGVVLVSCLLTLALLRGGSTPGEASGPLLTGQSGGSPADSQRVLAFVGAHVIPMDRDGVLSDHTVIVRGQRIETIGPATAVQVPDGAQRIDARGRYLIPGLTDMHVHIDRAEHEGDLLLYLANGVTAIRNMHAAAGTDVTTWRDEIARGQRDGPTIYTSGPAIRSAADSAAVDRILQQHRAGGYDFIKVYSDIPAAPYALLMRRARSEGIAVAGHVPVAVGVADAVRAGQRTLEHAEDLLQTHFAMRHDTARIPELVDILTRARTCVVPTLVVFSNVVRHAEQFPHLSGLQARPELRYLDPATRRSWAPEQNSYVRRLQQNPQDVPRLAVQFRNQYDFMKRIVAALDSAHVPLLAGSDANVPHTVPGFSLLDELEILVHEVGLTPRAALHSATRAPAACMEALEEFGSVAPGRRADLVLLDANPLDDIRHLRRRAGVMVRGEWLPEAELARRVASRPSQ